MNQHSSEGLLRFLAERPPLPVGTDQAVIAQATPGPMSGADPVLWSYLVAQVADSELFEVTCYWGSIPVAYAGGYTSHESAACAGLGIIADRAERMRVLTRR